MTDLPEQRDTPAPPGRSLPSAFHTAGDAADAAIQMRAAGAPLKDMWRYILVQLLDDYTSTLAHRGPAVAARIWQDAPGRTGEPQVDAAMAALAEHLARRDGWAAPAWSQEPDRDTPQWWFVTDLAGLHPRALVESPVSFRKRGVFITRDALVRA